MTRLFKLTPIAKQALWSKLSNEQIFVPTHFLIEGTAREGYRIMYVDENECGFDLFNSLIRSFYAVKLITQEMNDKGDCFMSNHFSVGATAWKYIPITL